MNAKEREIFPDEEYGLWLLLMRTYRAVAKTRTRELTKYGISVQAGAILLTALRQGELATPANIARELLLEPHTVSQHLTRMENKGLIVRIKDLERKNQVRIELTEEGFHNYIRSIKLPLTVMSALTPGEKRLLWGMLARLRQKAVRKLGIDKTTLYPPADPRELRSGFRSWRLQDQSQSNQGDVPDGASSTEVNRNKAGKRRLAEPRVRS